MNRIYPTSLSICAFISGIRPISFENKKIMILAVAAFGLIAACYLAFKYCFLRKQAIQRNITNEQSSPLTSEMENVNSDAAKWKSPIMDDSSAYVKTTPQLEDSPKVEPPKTPIKKLDFADLFPVLNASRVESDDDLSESENHDYPFVIAQPEMLSPLRSPLSSPSFSLSLPYSSSPSTLEFCEDSHDDYY